MTSASSTVAGAEPEFSAIALNSVDMQSDWGRDILSPLSC